MQVCSLGTLGCTSVSYIHSHPNGVLKLKFLRADAWFPPFHCHSAVAILPFPLRKFRKNYVAYVKKFRCAVTAVPQQIGPAIPFSRVMATVATVRKNGNGTTERQNGNGMVETRHQCPSCHPANSITPLKAHRLFTSFT